jgi:hypothetical protein
MIATTSNGELGRQTSGMNPRGESLGIDARGEAVGINPLGQAYAGSYTCTTEAPAGIFGSSTLVATPNC